MMAATIGMETDDAGNRLRFQLELEFVQCLANPITLTVPSVFTHVRTAPLRTLLQGAGESSVCEIY